MTVRWRLEGVCGPAMPPHPRRRLGGDAVGVLLKRFFATTALLVLWFAPLVGAQTISLLVTPTPTPPPTPTPTLTPTSCSPWPAQLASMMSTLSLVNGLCLLRDSS